jgi:predicted enzyme related to lactoylglutathione lyase
VNVQLSFLELQTADWVSLLNWYRDLFEFPLLLRVDKDRFALLQAGSVRLAIKGTEGANVTGSGILLAFEVDDLEAWQARVQARGIALEGPIKTSPEGYRRLRLRDPDGRAITLFAWVTTAGQTD